ncbi:MAG: hypothetical protein M1434_02805 [Chloroflexi bacterium]|nr:hypothetical protein [Chloroflexota bacterium]
MITFELGLYTITGASIVLVAHAVAARYPRLLKRQDLLPPGSVLTMLIVIVGAFIAGNILIGAIFILTAAHPIGLFDYQRYSLEIVRGFNSHEGLSWELASVPSIVLLLIVGYVWGYVIVNLRKLQGVEDYTVIALTVYGSIQLKWGMVRSDIGHIVVAFIPLIIVFLMLGKGWLRRENISVVWVTLLAALIVTYPLTSMGPFKQVQGWLQGTRSLRTQAARLMPQPTDPRSFLPPGLADDEAVSLAPLVNFPNENELGLTLGRPMVVPILSILEVHSNELARLYIDRLQQQGNKLEVMYGLDNVVSYAIDGVQNISRAPLVWEFLYRNFELKSLRAYGNGFYILKRRSKSIDINATPLAFTVTRPDSSTLLLKLGYPASCSLVRIGATVSYPLTSFLGRPNTLNLQFRSGQQTVKQTGMVAVETTMPFSTYVSLMDDDRFYTVFGAGKSQTKQWDSLQVMAKKTDILGVSPDRLEVDKIECVNP